MISRHTKYYSLQKSTNQKSLANSRINFFLIQTPKKIRQHSANRKETFKNKNSETKSFKKEDSNYEVKIDWDLVKIIRQKSPRKRIEDLTLDDTDTHEVKGNSNCNSNIKNFVLASPMPKLYYKQYGLKMS